MAFLRLLRVLPILSLVAAYTKLSDDALRSIPDAGNDFNIKQGGLLAPILIPRVPGTPGSATVRQHFVDFFSQNLPKWKLEFQRSSSTTPTSHGEEIPFVNVVATRDPPFAQPGEVGRLALVAHYDSKLTPHGFIGATDSAAPCAMLLHAARSIDEALTKKWEKMEAEGAADGLDNLDGEKGIQILLLDGEEAFLKWNDTDSVYGARSLAEEWENSLHPPMSTYHNNLSSISLFVLLDLLGASNPVVPSYFKTTHWAYKNMADVEARMRQLKLLKSSPNHPSNVAKSTKNSKARINQKREERLFLIDGEKDPTQYLGGFIEDDHVPFMKRGVEILHIIPTPFPRVWHEMDDDGDHLDLDTVEDWAKIVIGFAAEWMDLEGFMDVSPAKRHDAGDKNKQDEYIVTSKTELVPV